MVYERSITIQRHQHSGNLKVSVSDWRTDLLTGVGARDTYASKKVQEATAWFRLASRDVCVTSWLLLVQFYKWDDNWTTWNCAKVVTFCEELERNSGKAGDPPHTSLIALLNFLSHRQILALINFRIWTLIWSLPESKYYSLVILTDRDMIRILNDITWPVPVAIER